MALATAIKKLALNVLALGPTSRGFTGEEARNWVGSVCRHYLKRSGYSFRQSRWAIQRGFMPEQVENLGLTQENYKETISAREYAFLQPLNGGYSKWISDRITINSVFKPYLDKLPGCYYQIYKRYKETLIIPLQDRLAGDSFTDILNLLKEKGNLQVRQAEGDRHSLIQWTEETFFFDHKPCSEEEMIKKLSSLHIFSLKN